MKATFTTEARKHGSADATPAPIEMSEPIERSEPNLHRNNAAEWVMWMAIAPAVLLLRAISFAYSRLRG